MVMLVVVVVMRMMSSSSSSGRWGEMVAAVGLDASIRLVDCCVYWCWCCGTAAFVINWLPRMLML